MTYGVNPSIRQAVPWTKSGSGDIAWTWGQATEAGNLLLLLGSGDPAFLSGQAQYVGPPRWGALISGRALFAAPPGNSAAQHNGKSESGAMLARFHPSSGTGEDALGFAVEVAGANFHVGDVISQSFGSYFGGGGTTPAFVRGGLAQKALWVVLVINADSSVTQSSPTNGYTLHSQVTVSSAVGGFQSGKVGARACLYYKFVEGPFDDVGFSVTLSADVATTFAAQECVFCPPNVVAGFELGSGSPATQAFPLSTLGVSNVQPGIVLGGNPSAVAARTGGFGLALTGQQMLITDLLNQDDRAARLYLRWSAGEPTADHTIISQTHQPTNDGKSWITGLRYRVSDGKIYAFRSDGTTFTYAATGFDPVSWTAAFMRFDLLWVVNRTSPTEDLIVFDWQVDGAVQVGITVAPGVKFDSTSGAFTAATGGVGCLSTLTVGPQGGPGSLHVDDVFANLDQNTAAGIYPIGEGFVESFDLNGMGLDTFWTSFEETTGPAAISATSWQHLAWPNGDGNPLRVLTAAIDRWLEFLLEDTTAANPRTFAVWTQSARVPVSGDLATAANNVEVAGVELPYGQFLGTGTEVSGAGAYPVTRPDGGLWERSDLNALRLRWGYASPDPMASGWSVSLDHPTKPKLLAVMVEVEYSGVRQTAGPYWGIQLV